jgi:hypothetical protein
VGTGLGKGAIRICLVLSFTSYVTSSKAKSCANYTVLPSANGILHHAVLPKIGIVLVKQSFGHQGSWYLGHA